MVVKQEEHGSVGSKHRHVTSIKYTLDRRGGKQIP
jgi:hypothetical protein